jgi:hypothetical protein
MLGVILCQALKGVKASKPDRRLVTPQLISGLYIQVGESPLRRIGFRGAGNPLGMGLIDGHRVFVGDLLSLC